jgi:heat shock protein HslJ
MAQRSAGPWATRMAMLVAGLAMVLAVAACSGSTATPSPTAAVSAGGGLDGTWSLTKYTTPDGTEVAVPAAVTPTLTLSGNAASGNAGCNSFNATATIDGTSIKFSQVASTKMACPGPMSTVETAYLEALSLATSYTLNGDTLVLSGPGGKPSLTFVRGT